MKLPTYNEYMNKYSYVQMKERGIMEGKNNIDNCCCNVIHDDVVNKVNEDIPPEEILYDLADLFKVFGDTTRIKILCVLFQAEMCVCDIAALLGMTQSAISHQLRVLKQSRLVKYRKDGKVVYYSLDDEHVKGIFDQGLIHISEKK
jgi:DNA-binding transcriptional ArsR family regulator